jgi:hypothetical protein
LRQSSLRARRRSLAAVLMVAVTLRVRVACRRMLRCLPLATNGFASTHQRDHRRARCEPVMEQRSKANAKHKGADA